MTEIKVRDFSSPMSMGKLYAMMNWCEDNFGPGRGWDRLDSRWALDGTYRFMFTHSEDATAFLLRWS